MIFTKNVKTILFCILIVSILLIICVYSSNIGNKSTEKDKLQNVQEMTFRMTDNEKDCLLRWTKKSKHYLEFASGGSTQFVLKNSKA